MVLRFGSGAGGDFEEADRLGARTLAGAFGEVGGDGESRTSKLRGNEAQFRPARARGFTTDVGARLARQPPDVQATEVVHGRNLRACLDDSVIP